jgi:hypothetical protein
MGIAESRSAGMVGCCMVCRRNIGKMWVALPMVLNLELRLGITREKHMFHFAVKSNLL